MAVALDEEEAVAADPVKLELELTATDKVHV